MIPKDGMNPECNHINQLIKDAEKQVKGYTTYKKLIETKNAFVKKFALQVYAAFDELYEMWLSSVHSIAELDTLLGLAKGLMSIEESACRPILLHQEKSMVEFKRLWYLCTVPDVATDFIPNDVALGGGKVNVIILTGPKISVKAALLKQTCIAIIMARLGGYISKILREATTYSMAIFDESGRDASTVDDYTTAHLSLRFLSAGIGSLGMFVIHYQTLREI